MQNPSIEELKIGMTVKALHVPSIPAAEGQIVTIKAFRDYDKYPVADFKRTEEGMEHLTVEYYFTEWTQPLSPVSDTMPESDDEKIAVLTDDMYDLCNEVQRLQLGKIALEAEMRKVRAFFDIIGERATQEANDRSWCEEYDEVIEELNNYAPAGWQLPTRSREYNVQVAITVTHTVFTGIVVEAQSEDEAQHMVDNDLTSYLGEDISSLIVNDLSYCDPDEYDVEVNEIRAI